MSLGARCRIELRESNKLLQRMASAARKSLMQQGAYIRKVAQKSMPPRPYPSAPGHAPRSITGLLRDFIIFKWDGTAASMVVGPTLLTGSKNINPTIPEILEQGGSERALVVAGKDYQRRQRRMVTIAARPYMAPALERSKAQLPALWRDSIVA